MQAMLTTGLVADSSMLHDLLTDDGIIDDDESAEQKNEPDFLVHDDTYGRRHDLDEQVRQIYENILTRAPEHKVQPSLERVEYCLQLMGNPHKAYRSIHITGTNGKTSTARMCEALLRERGLRTGRFTSPHLVNVRERICIDGQAISQESFLSAWEDVAPFIEMTDEHFAPINGVRMSFFEVFVVLAFAAFADAPVDVAVVEVGMGGTWDATNVISSDVSVVMPIAVDHEKWLGSDIEDIAEEKLGIVKEHSVFVCAQQTEHVQQMAFDKAKEMHARYIQGGAHVHLLGREEAVGGQLISIRTPAGVYEDIPLPLRGDHQAYNAAIAVAAVEAFFDGRALDGEVVERAFLGVSSPGRLEVVRSSPVVVLDACHNPHGAHALAQSVEEYWPGRRIAVVSMMADKDIEGILAELEPSFDAVVITAMNEERAADPEDIAIIARDIYGSERVIVREDVLEAIALAGDLLEEDDSTPMASGAVVVCGSIMLIGHVRKMLGVHHPDGVM
ncbi:MAG: bifunctional folylpolyglutamate synthase/dihydrofolate synthase [Actinomycetaceae bacterium]|nr:bifunctional folylpolyglutamate synthase/dihydrofolate synthase [Actinomycetaceae bacterium]